MTNRQSCFLITCTCKCIILTFLLPLSALWAATILVAMASKKIYWQLNFKSPKGDFEKKWAWSTDWPKFVVWWCTLMYPSMRHCKATRGYRTASSFSGLLCKWAFQVCKWVSEKYLFPTGGNFCSLGPFIGWALTTKKLSFCSKWSGQDGWTGLTRCNVENVQARREAYCTLPMWLAI